jgi:hypothetical protein
MAVRATGLVPVASAVLVFLHRPGRETQATSARAVARGRRRVGLQTRSLKGGGRSRCGKTVEFVSKKIAQGAIHQGADWVGRAVGGERTPPGCCVAPASFRKGMRTSADAIQTDKYGCGAL